MLMPQRPTRPAAQTSVPPQNETTEAMLSRLVREGKISGGQAAQYRVWEAARPAADAGAAAMRAWMSGRPNWPGLPPMAMPASAPVPRPGAAAARPVMPPSKPAAGPMRPIDDAGGPVAPAAPAAPAKPSVLETLEKLYKEGRVTRAQLERYKKWEAERPGFDAGRKAFDAWTKARPEIPHLEEYLQQTQKPVIPPPPGAR